MPGDDIRTRLEAQAAQILGAARVEAAEIVHRAELQADDLLEQANRYAASRVDKADAARDQARRELVQAQEQALAIRSDAHRNAEAIVENATIRARADADELLRDGQRRLAGIIDEIRDAEVRATATRTMLDAEVEALKRVSVLQSAFADAVRDGPETVRRWTVDLTKEPFEEMVEDAVRSAVRRAVHPVTVRAGRYMVDDESSSLD